MMASRPCPRDLAHLTQLFDQWENAMCFGGGSKGNTQAPPPAVPNHWQNVTSPAQKNDNQMAALANADTVNSSTATQLNPGGAPDGQFGSELGKQGAM